MGDNTFHTCKITPSLFHVAVHAEADMALNAKTAFTQDHDRAVWRDNHGSIALHVAFDWSGMQYQIWIEGNQVGALNAYEFTPREVGALVAARLNALATEALV